MASWKFKKEQRSHSIRGMWIMLLLVVICYASGMGIAGTLLNSRNDQETLIKVAVIPQTETKTTGGPESLAEHVVVIVTLLGVTFTACVGLIGFIFISGQKATRMNIGELKTSTEKGIEELKIDIKDLYNKKLNTETHTQLCAILQLIKKGNGS